MGREMKSIGVNDGFKSSNSASSIVLYTMGFFVISTLCQISSIESTETKLPFCDPQLYTVPEGYECRCNSTQMKCADLSACIGIKFYCDGKEDCWDGSDEVESCSKVCPGQAVRCNLTGFCMNPEQFCDGIYDCPDFSDEKNCGACPKNFFQCSSNKQCIPNNYLCDGKLDCHESEDENIDLCGSCKEDEFQCVGNKTTCIPLTKRCDGISDCSRNSDELECVVNNNENKRSLNIHLNPLRLLYSGNQAYEVCSTNWTDRMSQKICQHFSLGNAVKTVLNVTIDARNETLIITEEMKENNWNIYEYLQKNETCQSGKGVGLICETIECGRLANTIKVDPNRYLINGKLARRGTHPWQVLVEHRGSVCGGSLINDRWVLTAAHCAVHYKLASDVKIFAGSVTHEVDHLYPEEKLFSVDKVIHHAGYYEDGKRDIIAHDVALLRLETPIEFTDTIRSICLPGPNDNALKYRVCVTTGFGQEKYTTDELRFIARGRHRNLMIGRMQAKSRENCWKNYEGIYGKKWNITEEEMDRVVCAGEVRNGLGTAACRGDSGGPLACNDYRGIWNLVGVTSLGIEKCSMSVYARVSYYHDWIKQMISENSP